MATTPATTNVRVMVVEDQVIVARDIKNRLEKLGYAVTAVLASGEEAVQRVAETRPDLVLMDIKLQGEMDGIEAAEQIRARFDIPVVYLTAYGDDETLERAKVTEPFGYLTKPLDARELRSTIETAIYKHHMEAALRRRNRELALLNRASQAFSSTLDLDQVFVTVLEEVRHLMDVVACSIWLIDPETDELVCQQATGPQGKSVRGWRLMPGEGIAGVTMSSGESQIVLDAQGDGRYHKGVEQQAELVLRSILSVPLQFKQSVIGVLQAVDTMVGRFDADDLALLEPLAASAAIAIENARLYEQAQQEIAERKQVEEALRENEARYRAISELTSDYAYAFRIEPDGTAVREWMTEAYAQITGYSRDEVDPHSDWEELVHPDDKARYRQRIQALLSGLPQTSEYRIIDKSGRVHWLRAHARPAWDKEQRRVARIYGAVQDFTERKQAEEALRESEERYRFLFEQANDAIFVNRIETDEIIEANRRACQLTGYTREELLTMRVPDLQAPEVRGKEGNTIKSELGRYEDNPFEALNVHRDGTRIPVEVSTSRMVRAGDELALSTVRDIAERKQAERALQESEERLRRLFETMTEGVILIDLDGQIIQANPAAERILRLERSEIRVRNYVSPEWKVFRSDGTPMPAEEMAGPRAMEEKRPVIDVIMGLEHPDGSVSWLNVSAAPLVDKAGKLGGVVGTFADITERVQTEEELRKYRDHLEELVEERTTELQREITERRRAEQEATALAETARLVSSTLDLEEVLDLAAEYTMKLFQVDHCAVTLYDEAQGTYRYIVGKGIPAQVLATLREMELHPTNSFREAVLETLQPLIIDDVPSSIHLAPQTADLTASLDVQSSLTVPMEAGGRPLGFMELTIRRGRPRRFTAEEAALAMAIARQAAMAVENAWLYEQAQQVAVLEERQRLARELHDSVTQSLYSLVLLAEGGRRLAESGDVESAQRYFSDLEEIGVQSLKEMRLLVYELRPLALAEEGLIGALQQRLDTVEGRAGVEARLLVEREIALAPPAEEALYGIAQEALNNALKHASASSLIVRIRSGDGKRVEMEIVDNGCGFTPQEIADLGGLGLTTMRERAESVGGTLYVTSAPGEGTTVKVFV